jgi:putative hemolysin
MDELLIIALLILLNGFFAFSEIALLTARKSKLDANAKQGRKNAGLAYKLAQSPNQLLSIVQIGITLIGILTGIFSGNTIAERLFKYFSQWEFLKPYAYTLSIAIVLVIIAYFTLIFGELLPKRLAISNPEKFAEKVAKPMLIIATIMKPFILILENTLTFLTKIFRIRDKNEKDVSEEEIKAILEEGKSSGAIQEIEQDIVENVFYLGDRRVGSLMTHYKDVEWIDLQHNINNIIQLVKNNCHSIYPVIEGNLNKVTGIIETRKLLLNELENNSKPIYDLIQPVLFFPENVKAYKVLEKFREKRIFFGIVVDEYGATLGIITINDIIDVIVGDISSDSNVEEIVKRDEDSWLVDAQIPIDDFIREFELAENIIEEPAFNTLGGLVLHVFDRIPRTGEVCFWNDFRIEIVDMDGKRIDKLLIKRLKKESELL